MARKGRPGKIKVYVEGMGEEEPASPASRAVPCENCGHIKLTKAKTGPKPFLLDEIKIARMKELFSAGCTVTEVAHYFGTSPETFACRLKQTFGCTASEYKQRCFYKGDAMIRESQYKLGVDDKDRGMLIWLGKNRLNQSDNPKQDQEFNSQVGQYLDHLQSLPVENKGRIPGLRGKPSQLAEREKYRNPTFESETD